MIFYISITTLALSLLILYYNYNVNKNSILLSGYLIILCVYSLSHYFLFQNQSVLATAILFRHTTPLLYLAGPILYLYVRRSLKNSLNWSKKDYIHFIPAIIGLINLLPYFFTPFEQKIKFVETFYLELNFNEFPDKALFYSTHWGLLIRNILFGAYILAAGLLLYRHWSNKTKNEFESECKKQFQWQIFLVCNAALLSICSIALTYSFYVKDVVNKAENHNLIVTLISGVTFTLIPAVMIFFPQVIYRINETNYLEENKTDEKKKIVNDKSMYILAARIIEHFENEKPYLKNSFSLEDLATQLEVPKHQLYTCLNTCINKKFTQLRTNYRVEYAKKLLLKANLDSISLQGVWMNSGFSSKTNFFTTFKEETGLTPTEFIQLEKK